MKVSLRAEGVQGGPKHFCSGSWEALLPLLNFTFHLAAGVTWQLQTNAPRAFCFHLTLTSCEGLQHRRKKIFPLSMTSPSQEWRKGGGRQEKERRRRGWHSWWQPQYHLLLTNSSCCFTYTPTTQQQPNEREACCRGPRRLQRFLTDNYSHLLHPFTLMWFLRALSFTSHLRWSSLEPIHSTLRLHRRGFVLLPCHVTFTTCLNKMQSDKFPATSHFSVHSKSQIYLNGKTVFIIHITYIMWSETAYSIRKVILMDVFIHFQTPNH